MVMSRSLHDFSILAAASAFICSGVFSSPQELNKKAIMMMVTKRPKQAFAVSAVVNVGA